METKTIEETKHKALIITKRDFLPLKINGTHRLYVFWNNYNIRHFIHEVTKLPEVLKAFKEKGLDNSVMSINNHELTIHTNSKDEFKNFQFLIDFTIAKKQ